LFRAWSPSERYTEGLREAGLTESAMGRAWLKAGQGALSQPMEVRAPLRETGYFTAESPSAIGYRLDLTRGRTLDVDVQFESQEPARLFVDLFELVEGRPKLVASLSRDTTAFRHEVRRDGTYLLRLQPELLGGGRYTVVQRTVASIGFPIPGLDTLAIKSRFGVERDGGKRSHEGVDIFAKRLTPVIAVRDGIAQQGTNHLGGNVVWLYDYKAFRRYYYAHLDFWSFKGIRMVSKGDTLGFVGNTGNAVTTPTHLHFGIYEVAAVNPFPFLAPNDRVPDPIKAPLNLLASWVRVRVPRGDLRAGPDRDATSLDSLFRGEIARVEAVTGNMLRIRLPDGKAGYVSLAGVRPTETRLSLNSSGKAPGGPRSRSAGVQ
jgi:murein DD-endopeptidase MepM/ murein hydrolase activator NlpD